ncbi:MAG TPA: hypothetical protein VMG10_24500 [Gemmataceae bacterium]|nr:hypothetical protein [Gemmataceae bacterium]
MNNKEAIRLWPSDEEPPPERLGSTSEDRQTVQVPRKIVRMLTQLNEGTPLKMVLECIYTYLTVYTCQVGLTALEPTKGEPKAKRNKGKTKSEGEEETIPKLAISGTGNKLRRYALKIGIPSELFVRIGADVIVRLYEIKIGGESLFDLLAVRGEETGRGFVGEIVHCLEKQLMETPREKP